MYYVRYASLRIVLHYLLKRLKSSCIMLHHWCLIFNTIVGLSYYDIVVGYMIDINVFYIVNIMHFPYH